MKKFLNKKIINLIQLLKLKKTGFTRTPNLASQELPAVQSTMLKLVSGFTLVETLVAVSILTLATTATLTSVQKGLTDTNRAKDQITAFYLAQEGMEYIRNIKDANTLKILSNQPINWLDGLSGVPADPCYFNKVCRIDYQLIPVYCGMVLNSCINLNQDDNSKIFAYNGAWPSLIFKREIQFRLINADEAVAIIMISWTSKGATKTFRVEQSFYNR